MKTTCTIWSVLGIAFVILVMSGWAHWERAQANESISEEPIVVDTDSAPILFTPYELQAYHGYRGGIDLVCMPDSADANDCLVPYSTAPLRITSESLWEENWTINITGSRPITIVCDDIDTANWFKATEPLIERLGRMEQMIEAMHAVICEAPDPQGNDDG